MTLRELEQRLATWHAAKYGGKPVDMAATTDKLTEEVNELAERLEQVALSRSAEWDLIDRSDVARIMASEAADVVFVLCLLCRGAGVSLADAVAYKLDIIEQRLTNPGAGR